MPANGEQGTSSTVHPAGDPQQDPGLPAAGDSREREPELERQISFWDALMRALASIHS